jgi:hypothetical protein
MSFFLAQAKEQQLHDAWSSLGKGEENRTGLKKVKRLRTGTMSLHWTNVFHWVKQAIS